MNLSARIQAADADLIQAKDALVEMTNALEQTPDDQAILAQVDELSQQVEQKSASLDALKRAEKALAERAQSVAAPAVVQANHMKSPAKDLMVKMMAVDLIAKAQRKDPVEVLESRYGDTVGLKEAYDFKTKTAVNPMTTGTTGYGAELVRNDTAEYLDALKTTSVAASLMSVARTINFNGAHSVSIPTRAALGANLTEPAWVAEAASIPLTNFQMTTTRLDRYKLACITTYSRELANQTNGVIEKIVKDAILDAHSQVLDQALLSNAAARVGVRPAGMLNGLSGNFTGAGDTTGGATSLVLDIKAMLGALQSAGTGAKPVLVMNTATRLATAMQQSSLGEFLYRGELANGQLLGMPVISSNNVPTGVVVMIDADSVAFGYDTFEFDVSETATITEANADLTAPTQDEGAAGAIGTVGGEVGPAITGGIEVVKDGTTATHAVGYTARSLWQTASWGVRFIAPFSMAQLRAGAVAQRTSVTW